MSNDIISPAVDHEQDEWISKPLPGLENVRIQVSQEQLDRGHFRVCQIRGEGTVYITTSYTEFTMWIDGKEVRVKIVEAPPSPPPFTYPMTDLPELG